MFNKPTLWELSEFDCWNDSDNAKDLVEQVILARREKDVRYASDRLARMVISDGCITPLALPVTTTILSYIPKCTRVSQIACLELLGQIVATDEEMSTSNTKAQCLHEIKKAAWWFLHGLEYDLPEAIWLYVDLIGALGDNFEDFRPKATAYLNKALSRDICEDDKILIHNTLVWEE